MNSPEEITERSISAEEITEMSISALESQLSDIVEEKSTLQKTEKGIKRAIARTKGELADSYEKLFPDQDLTFKMSMRGITSFVRGYTAEEIEAGKVLTETTAYYCSGCGGWVRGEPNRLSIFLDEKTKEVRYSCRIDGHSLGAERVPIPGKEK